jgi:transposase InsO family protein
LAALRLQRWAMILMAHDYTLQFRKSEEHANCDGLSRLPAGKDNFLAQELPVNYFSYVNELPVEAKQIALATRNDPILAKVTDHVRSGWPAHCTDENLRPYFNRRMEISVDQDCLLWGYRVIIPPCYRQKLLQELHMTHPGIVRMKAMSRSFLWFPGLDSAIEDLVNSCHVCQSMQKDPPSAPLIPWEYPSRCWERVHIDFAEFDRKNYLIVVDAHTKWLEVIEMRTTTTQQTVKELRKLFASYGIPELLVSDNGPQLVSSEMEQFLRNNGIQHSLSPPYHPASNGAAERCLQTVKNALKKFLLSDRVGDLSHALQNFLLHYRITPHATTGRSPAEMFLKRLPRTRFSLLKPDVSRTVQMKQESQRKYHDSSGVTQPPTFQEGEIVRIKNAYDGLERYVKGVVAKVIGPYRYVVKSGRRCRYVHVEHMRKTGELDYESQVRIDDDVVTSVPHESYVPLSVPETVDTQMTPLNPVPMNPQVPKISPAPMRSNVSVKSPGPSKSPSPVTVPQVPSTPRVRRSVPECTPRRSVRIRKAPNRLIESM